MAVLNQVAPLLIMSFAVPPPAQPTDFVGPPGPTGLLDSLLELVGVPVPIYLDEKLTGIIVQNETRGVDIETNAQQLRTGAVLYDQRGLDSIVTVNLVGSKDSMVLVALLAMSDMIFQLVVAKAYKVSYFNGPTVIINGLLHGFQTNSNSNEDKIHITLQISKANQATTATTVITALPKITGALPVAG